MTGYSTLPLAPLDAMSLLADGAPHIGHYLIDPEVARCWLKEYNTQNRPPNATVVRQYARTMAEGRWSLSHQGVAVSKEGILTDGQQRLMAVVQSGTTIPASVTVGLPHASTFSVVDVGRMRSGADAVHLFAQEVLPEGMATYSSHVAATVRVLRAHDEGIYQNASTYNVRLDNDETITLLKHYGLPELIEDASLTAHVRGVFSTASLAAFVYLAGRRFEIDREFLRKAFLLPIKTGAPITSARDPRLAVRNRGLRAAASKERVTAKTRQEALGLVTHAWNLFVQGREVASIRPPKDMPTILRPSEDFMAEYSARYF